MASGSGGTRLTESIPIVLLWGGFRVAMEPRDADLPALTVRFPESTPDQSTQTATG
jgi:hypothetical protein